MFPLNYYQFQCCHKQHLLRVANTRRVETNGLALVSGTLAINATSLGGFTTDVCLWGGKTGHRVLGKISKTDPKIISTGFKNAIAAIKIKDVLTAKNALKPISGLGQFSYSSKHIRMLAPDLSGVLDNIIESHLKSSYGNFTQAKLYVDYCAYCVEKASELTNASVKKGDYISSANCGSEENEPEVGTAKESTWLAADVDMACFAWLQGWCKNGHRSAIVIGSKNQNEDDKTKFKPSSTPRRISSSNFTKTNFHNTPIYLNEFDKYGKRHKHALRLVSHCADYWNLGAICWKHNCLDLQDQNCKGGRYLIGEIAARGGNFLQETPRCRVAGTCPPKPRAIGETCCWGVAAYEAGVHFKSMEDAVRYLKKYFVVKTCPDNEVFTQQWIDNL